MQYPRAPLFSKAVVEHIANGEDDSAARTIQQVEFEGEIGVVIARRSRARARATPRTQSPACSR